MFQKRKNPTKSNTIKKAKIYFISEHDYKSKYFFHKTFTSNILKPVINN